MPLIYLNPYINVDPTDPDNVFGGITDTTLPDTPLMATEGLIFTNGIIDLTFRGIANGPSFNTSIVIDYTFSGNNDVFSEGEILFTDTANITFTNTPPAVMTAGINFGR